MNLFKNREGQSKFKPLPGKIKVEIMRYDTSEILVLD